jgi:hypothetical protein
VLESFEVYDHGQYLLGAPFRLVSTMGGTTRHV